MRSFTVIFFLLMMQLTAVSQNDKAVKKDSVIKEKDLSDSQWKEWYRLDTTWTKYMFPSCLHENKIKLSCGKCESVYITVQMKIDSSGQMVRYTLISGKMCGEKIPEKLVSCFLDFFKFLEFPACLRNIILEVKLGNGLKC
jgi:hypothetical protein